MFLLLVYTFNYEKGQKKYITVQNMSVLTLFRIFLRICDSSKIFGSSQVIIYLIKANILSNKENMCFQFADG